MRMEFSMNINNKQRQFCELVGVERWGTWEMCYEQVERIMQQRADEQARVAGLREWLQARIAEADSYAKHARTNRAASMQIGASEAYRRVLSQLGELKHPTASDQEPE